MPAILQLAACGDVGEHVQRSCQQIRSRQRTKVGRGTAASTVHYGTSRPMNDSAFDRFTRRLSRMTTRRGTFGTMAAIASFLCAETRHSVRAQPDPFAGSSLGAACTEAAECAQVQACNVPGPVTCADNGIADDGRLTCCLAVGGFCLDATHCCAGLECVGDAVEGCGAGSCQSPPWPS